MAMIGGKTGLPPFPRRFGVLRDTDGVRRPIRIDETGMCSPVHPSFVEDEILKYYMMIQHSISVSIMPMEFRQGLKAYLSLAPVIPEEDIKPLLQKSTKGLTWNRLSFDIEDGPTPVFDEIMSRCSNAEAFMAWFGSLLVPDSDTEQYVWCFGEGMNGKSRIFNLFSKILGSGYAPEQPPRGDGSRFWSSGVVGKRLVVFNDCDDIKFPASGFFKNLSGGEPIRVEIKGGASYKTTLNAKFAFVSNLDPLISGSQADRRRAIYVKMEAIKGPVIPTKRYDAMLEEEAPRILKKCLDTYKRLCPRGGKIPTDTKGLEDVISSAEEPIEAFCEEHLVFEEGAYMRPYELLNLMKANDIRWTQEQRKYIRWLIREKGIEKGRLTDKDRTRVYLGVRAVGNSEPGY